MTVLLRRHREAPRCLLRIADRAGEYEEQRPNAAVADRFWIDEYDIDSHRSNFHAGRTGPSFFAKRFGGHTNRNDDTAGGSGATYRTVSSAATSSRISFLPCSGWWAWARRDRRSWRAG